MIKLLYPFANVSGIFFPVGKLIDGGTCQFASQTCLDKCCANSGNKCNVSHEMRIKTSQYFIENNIETIVLKLLKELSNSEIPIISWFASGDCMLIMTIKIYEIVNKLKGYGVIQNGITRNKELWKKIKKIQNPNTRFLLTLEPSRDGISIDNNSYPSLSTGLYSIPHYDLGVIDILKVSKKNRRISDGCGGGYYEEHIAKEKILKHSYLKLDCRVCYNEKKGCFSI